MTPQELRKLLRLSEGLKLDFKREYKLQAKVPDGVDRQLWSQYIAGQWDELIKDILALTNGNFGTVKNTGFLIIGVDDKLTANGTRQLYDSSYLEITSQQILTKVNSTCYPPIPQLNCDFVQLDSCKICVISIPPSPHVHETTRQLEITKGYFDSSGKFTLNTKATKTYTAHTAFIRRGEDIFPATNEERRKLEEEKSILTNPIRNMRSSSRNEKNSTPHNSKPAQSSVKVPKLSAEDRVRENLKISVLEPLMKKYMIFRIGVLFQIIWIVIAFLFLVSLLGNFPSEMIIILPIPLLILLTYFNLFCFTLKSSAEKSGFYRELKLFGKRNEMRRSLKKMALIELNFLDAYLYEGYITLFIKLVLPSKKSR